MPISIDKLVRTSRKTIAIIVQKDGTLTVRAPLRMTDARIRSFIHSHEDWIVETQTKVRSAVTLPPKCFQDGETFFFLGQSHPLQIVPRQSTRLDFDGEIFRLSKAALPNASRIFVTWYKAQARALLAERIRLQVDKYGFRYKKIRISSARTRWGSCSTSGTISFTYRLIMAPLDVIDYVVVHELVHTQVKDHSKNFWHHVAEIMPDYKQRLNWLKKNGQYLTLD